jgi:hypothetical protein
MGRKEDERYIKNLDRSIKRVKRMERREARQAQGKSGSCAVSALGAGAGLVAATARLRGWT